METIAIECYLAVNYVVGNYPSNLLQIFGSRKVLDIVSVSYLIQYPNGNVASGELICKEFDVAEIFNRYMGERRNGDYRLLQWSSRQDLAERIWEQNRGVAIYGSYSPMNFRKLIKLKGLKRTEIGNELFLLLNPHLDPEVMGEPFKANRVNIHVTEQMEYFALCSAMEFLHGTPDGFRLNIIKNPLPADLLKNTHVSDIGSVDWLAKMLYMNQTEVKPKQEDNGLPKFTDMEPTSDQDGSK